MKRNGPKHRALIKEASSKAMTEYWKEWRRKRGIRRQKIRILCLCGCRNRVRQPGQKFVNGHNGSLILKHCRETIWKNGKAKMPPGFGEKVSKRLKEDWKRPEYRRIQSKNRSISMKRNWRNEDYARNVIRSHVHPSRPQISLFKSLCARGFKRTRLEYYVGSYPLDIAYLPKKINIEVDGKYWHRNKKHRDRRRDGFLRKLGWVVIRVDSKLWRESKVWERL